MQSKPLWQWLCWPEGTTFQLVWKNTVKITPTLNRFSDFFVLIGHVLFFSTTGIIFLESVMDPVCNFKNSASSKSKPGCAEPLSQGDHTPRFQAQPVWTLNFISCLFSSRFKNDAEEWKSKDIIKLHVLKCILGAVFYIEDLFGYLKSYWDFLVPEDDLLGLQSWLLCKLPIFNFFIFYFFNMWDVS